MHTQPAREPQGPDATDDGREANGLSPAQPPAAPSRTQTQQQLVELWVKLLDVPEVGPDDNFFDLGGHSLLAARAVSEIERTFGIRVSIKTLMIGSLSQVAAEIDRLAARRSTAEGRNGADAAAPDKSEISKVGRLASWFKSRRN